MTEHKIRKGCDCSDCKRARPRATQLCVARYCTEQVGLREFSENAGLCKWHLKDLHAGKPVDCGHGCAVSIAERQTPK